MRYLVHRGTGTIIDPLDDVVLVDVDDDNLEEEDILALADSVPAWDKAVFMRGSEVVAGDKRMSGAYLSDYSVSFICDYMTITLGVHVPGIVGVLDDEDDEDKAIELANELIVNEYGFSPMGFCHETSVDYCGAIL